MRRIVYPLGLARASGETKFGSVCLARALVAPGLLTRTGSSRILVVIGTTPVAMTPLNQGRNFF